MKLSGVVNGLQLSNTSSRNKPDQSSDLCCLSEKGFKPMLKHQVERVLGKPKATTPGNCASHYSQVWPKIAHTAMLPARGSN